MSAPKRWLDDPGVPDDERDLLQAGLGMDPPPEAQAAVWAALLAKVPPVPPPTGGGGGAAAGKAAAAKAGAAASGAVAVGTGILKSALIGAGSAVALLATYAVVTPAPTAAPPEPPPPAAVVVAAPPADRTPPRFAPSAPREATEPSATPTSAAAAPGAAAAMDHHADAVPSANATPSGGAGSATTPPADRETLLREESRLLGEARDALRGGDAARALGLLEQLRARFPGGMLAQEREALTIEALARSGRRADASARAAAFLQAYPTSPLAARVQTFAN